MENIGYNAPIPGIIQSFYGEKESIVDLANESMCGCCNDYKYYFCFATNLILIPIKTNSLFMKIDILQETLKANLFDIGDNDDRLRQLKSAIGDLAKKIKEEKYASLSVYTLAMLDYDITDSEPVMVETESIVVGYWEALRIRYNKMPINVIRGVILNAVYNLGIEDTTAARIIYLTASNFYPYMKLTAETAIIKSIISEFAELAEKNAVEEWFIDSEAPELKLQSLKIDKNDFEKIKFDESELKKDYEKSFEDFPQMSHQTYNTFFHEDYRKNFIDRATGPIAENIDVVLSSLSESLNSMDIEGPINKFLAGFKKSLNEVMKSSMNTIESIERRNKLLWWKETLYSTSLKKGYREVDKNILPLIMANDLYYLVPAITPLSVDYLLIDTVGILSDGKDKPVTFLEFLKSISEDQKVLLSQSFEGQITDYNGRLSITQFISLFLINKVQVSEFKARTGIEDTEKISNESISVIVFHDLMVKHLIS